MQQNIHARVSSRAYSTLVRGALGSDSLQLATAPLPLLFTLRDTAGPALSHIHDATGRLDANATGHLKGQPSSLPSH